MTVPTAPVYNIDLSNSAVTVTKLKEEVNHLVLQLIYERHLREKYEEDANRLHFVKIERDQLMHAKYFSDKRLSQLVEQYKNDVEKSLGDQYRMETKAYEEELNDQSMIIE